jgi:hypothetical protein
MNINWPVAAIVGLLALLLVVFLIRKNQKDKREMERTMNRDYDKPGEHESERD